ncbi:MAG TPA: VPLPA-CTERM sorting domain-containing protein [Steroidobacteraceae bacterium]|nr:VPLPA-CTERM sorting domain-containing protein [Steroidobacteraceae bacterium]
MKISLKQILAVGALAVASTSAFADTALPETGNGELVLYVLDTTQNTVYARGLGVNMDNIITTQQITSNGHTVAAQPITGFDLGTIGPDANMNAFLGTIAPSDNVEWAVLGGAYTGITNTLGAMRFATTTTADLSAGTTLSNSNLKGSFVNINGVQTTLNGFIGTGVADDMASTQPNGIYGQTGAGYPTAPAWFGGGLTNAITGLGTTANFYLLATGGGSTGAKAVAYSMYSLTLGTDGTLTMNAPMSTTPIPAAFWLLGSGLAGLVGIGRRKQV